MTFGRPYRIKNARGQTLVEFALVVSLFLAILFGIVEFGRAWWYSNHLNNTVRAAARHAAVLGNVTGIPSYVTNELSGFMPLSNISSIRVYDNGVDITDNTGASTPPNRGDTIEVTVVYKFDVLSGSIIPFLSGTRPISRSASMIYEGSGS